MGIIYIVYVCPFIVFSRSHLLTFDVNLLINIYSLSFASKSLDKKSSTSLDLECLAEIRIAEYLPHPSCLVSMDLATLNYHLGI